MIFAVPIRLGRPSRVAQRVLERMDHWLFMNERGMNPMYGKVAAVAITGNEDSGHDVYAEMFQAVNDVHAATGTPHLLDRVERRRAPRAIFRDRTRQ